MAGEKRERIDTGSSKRFVKRNRSGQFKEADEVGSFLAADRPRKAKTKVRPGYGDTGDQGTRSGKSKPQKAEKKIGRKK
jgi:hypothetical protein